MNYTLKIKGEEGDIDIIEEGIITKADFSIYQQNMASDERADKLFNTLIIEGKLNDKSQKETKQILDWSKMTDRKNIYKSISLQVIDNKELIRDYFMKNMYCVSYEECFDATEHEGKKDSAGSFILTLKQRAGNIETIKVEC